MNKFSKIYREYKKGGKTSTPVKVEGNEIDRAKLEFFAQSQGYSPKDVKRALKGIDRMGGRDIDFSDDQKTYTISGDLSGRSARGRGVSTKDNIALVGRKERLASGLLKDYLGSLTGIINEAPSPTPINIASKYLANQNTPSSINTDSFTSNTNSTSNTGSTTNTGFSTRNTNTNTNINKRQNKIPSSQSSLMASRVKQTPTIAKGKDKTATINSSATNSSITSPENKNTANMTYEEAMEAYAKKRNKEERTADTAIPNNPFWELYNRWANGDENVFTGMSQDQYLNLLTRFQEIENSFNEVIPERIEKEKTPYVFGNNQINPNKDNPFGFLDKYKNINNLFEEDENYFKTKDKYFGFLNNYKVFDRRNKPSTPTNNQIEEEIKILEEKLKNDRGTGMYFSNSRKLSKLKQQLKNNSVETKEKGGKLKMYLTGGETDMLKKKDDLTFSERYGYQINPRTYQIPTKTLQTQNRNYQTGTLNKDKSLIDATNPTKTGSNPDLGAIASLSDFVTGIEGLSKRPPKRPDFNPVVFNTARTSLNTNALNRALEARRNIRPMGSSLAEQAALQNAVDSQISQGKQEIGFRKAEFDAQDQQKVNMLSNQQAEANQRLREQRDLGFYEMDLNNYLAQQQAARASMQSGRQYFIDKQAYQNEAEGLELQANNQAKLKVAELINAEYIQWLKSTDSKGVSNSSKSQIEKDAMKEAIRKKYENSFKDSSYYKGSSSPRNLFSMINFNQ